MCASSPFACRPLHLSNHGCNMSHAGPGKWELQAHKQVRSSKCKTTDVTKAVPTVTHMTFVKLYEEGLLKCVISQNVDGLHRRSGLPQKGGCMEPRKNPDCDKMTIMICACAECRSL